MIEDVVVTGLGIVSSLGLDVETHWRLILDGESGISPLVSDGLSGFPCKVGGVVHGLVPAKVTRDRKALRTMNKSSQMAMAACRMAVEDSGILADGINGDSVGLYLGLPMVDYEIPDLIEAARASIGATGQWDLKRFGSIGYRKIYPLWAVQMLNNIMLSHIAIEFGFKGPNLVLSPYSASGIQAVGEAAKAIQRGEAPVIVVGGVSSRINEASMARHSLSNSLSTSQGNAKEVSRPFDRDRDGWVLGEGAGILVLEESSHAEERNAKIYGRVTGFGTTFHGKDEGPVRNGIFDAMKGALEDAELEAEQVDFVAAHAPSCKVLDSEERLAIERLFGSYARSVFVSSSKSMIGNALAAAGPIDVIHCILSIRDQTVPPTINLETPDSMFDLNYVTGTACAGTLDAALTNSVDLEGQCASLVVKSYSNDA